MKPGTLARLIACCSLFMGAHVWSASPAGHPLDLPTQEEVLKALEADFDLQRAQLERQQAVHSAHMQTLGPAEWTLESSAQRRHMAGAAAGGTEWSAQLQRSVRWPGKAELDAQLGQGLERQALLAQQWTQREASKQVLDAWLDWLAAAESLRLAQAQIQVAQDNLRAVRLRERAGDASQLERRLAEADLAGLRPLLLAAQAEEARAQALLAARHPSLPRQAKTLADPQALVWTLPQWEAQVLEQHPKWTLAHQQWRQAQLQARRQAAERKPDPTIGVFTASEAMGQERVWGLSLSLPLGGRYREEAALEAATRRDLAELDLARVKRDLALALAQQVTQAQTAFTSWQASTELVGRWDRNVQSTQRAYALGEADLPALLSSRRQHLDAQMAQNQARLSALRAHYHLLVDAGQLWPALTNFASSLSSTGDHP